ncbi:MAG: pinensin family lanthipeptide [Bacteroidota bacterium]
MKDKLKIADLKVKSFITDSEMPQIKGGKEAASDNRACAFSVFYCPSVNVYCPTEDRRCL